MTQAQIDRRPGWSEPPRSQVGASVHARTGGSGHSCRATPDPAIGQIRPTICASSAPSSDEGAASVATHPSSSRVPPEWHPAHGPRRRAGGAGRGRGVVVDAMSRCDGHPSVARGVCRRRCCSSSEVADELVDAALVVLRAASSVLEVPVGDEERARGSARFEVVSERLADDFGGRNSFLLGAASESLLEFWIEPDRFDG